MSKVILVIEDDIDIRESITELLETEDYVVHSAENGQAGLDILNSMDPLPSAILVDVMMPVMDGYLFCMEKLKIEKFKQVPVIIMSADSNLAEKHKNAGADGYIKKPLDIFKLLETLEQYIPKTK